MLAPRLRRPSSKLSGAAGAAVLGAVGFEVVALAGEDVLGKRMVGALDDFSRGVELPWRCGLAAPNLLDLG
jgi:hypothetical protein